MSYDFLIAFNNNHLACLSACRDVKRRKLFGLALKDVLAMATVTGGFDFQHWSPQISTRISALAFVTIP